MSDENKMVEMMVKLVINEIAKAARPIAKHAAWSRVYREVLVAAIGVDNVDALVIAKKAADVAAAEYDEFQTQHQKALVEAEVQFDVVSKAINGLADEN